jgi:ankyrin repeat protein
VHCALHNGAVQLAAELLCAVHSKHGAAEVTRLLQQIEVSSGRTAVHTTVLLNGTAELLSAVSSVPVVAAAVAAAAVAGLDKAGNTALHTAACSEPAQDLVALLACYASSSDKQAALAVKNSAGLTVTQLALYVGVPECVAALQQYSTASHHYD